MSKDNQCNNYRVLADFMAALGACMLLSSAFLGVLLAPCNRQDLFWSRTDTVVLFAVIFMGAILLDGVHWSSRAGQKVAAPPFVRTVFM